MRLYGLSISIIIDYFLSLDIVLVSVLDNSESQYQYQYHYCLVLSLGIVSLVLILSRVSGTLSGTHGYCSKVRKAKKMQGESESTVRTPL